MKKTIIGIIIAIILIVLVGFGTYSYINNKKNKDNVQNEKLLVTNIKDGNFNEATILLSKMKSDSSYNNLSKELTDYENNNNTFNKEIELAFSNFNENNDISKFSNTINNISTENLPENDITKLNNIKKSIPEITKVSNLKNSIKSKNFTKAENIFKTINQEQLTSTGTFTKEYFTDLNSQIVQGIKNQNSIKNTKTTVDKESNSTTENPSKTITSTTGNSNGAITVGFLRAAINKGIPGIKVVQLPSKIYNEIEKNPIFGEPNYIGSYVSDYFVLYNNPNITYDTPDSVVVGAPNYSINGESAYMVGLGSSGNLNGGHGRVETLVGANGHVYTNEEIFNAVKAGTFKALGNSTPLTLQAIENFGVSGSGICTYAPKAPNWTLPVSQTTTYDYNNSNNSTSTNNNNNNNNAISTNSNPTNSSNSSINS